MNDLHGLLIIKTAADIVKALMVLGLQFVFAHALIHLED